MIAKERHLKVAPETTTPRRRKAPGPVSPWELFQHIRRMQKNYVEHFEFCQKEFGDVMRLRFPTDEILFFRPEYAQHFLKTNAQNYRRSVFYRELIPLLGGGILMSDGEEWKSQRRTLAPEFQHTNLQRFVPTILDDTDSMCERWRKGLSRIPVREVAREMTRLTFRVAGAVFFGSEILSHANAAAAAFATYSEVAIERTTSVFVFPYSFPTPLNRRGKKALQQLNSTVLHIIESRRKSNAGHVDILTRLLSATDPETGAPLSDEEVRAEVMTFMLAGHETTSNALSWCLYLLAKYPLIQQRAQAEIDQVLKGDRPSYADLANLSYLKCVFQEAMRLYPPVASLSRLAIHEDTIGDYEVPAGMTVETSPWVLHRHPDYWTNPTHFDPERFLPSRIKDQHPFAYIPFGGGPRECIGKHFALIEGVLVLARVLSKFRLDLVSDHPVEILPLITVRPKYGIKLKIALR